MLRQTHLLIAGTTGSGKSNVINGIMNCALYQSPATSQFILIDPTRVELSDYSKLQHTIVYASEPQEMINALQTALRIIDDRYKEMQRKRQRMYTGSKIIIVIDEMADLLITDRRTVSPLLQRITQIGRASNVMLIGATQQPTNDIIGNSITVNMDARVGLRTRNAQESRNIIGKAGCELLPRFGQGYYVTPEQSALYNIPAANYADIARLIDYWKHNKGKLSLF